MNQKISTRIVLLMLHAIGAFSIYKIFNGTAIANWYYYTIAGYFLIHIIGYGACYHRLIVHKSFTTYPIIKRIMLFFAVIGGQGSPIFWAAVHRKHHSFTDTEKDIHSPIHGFWHSYILWTVRFNPSDINVKLVVDLLRDPDCLFLHKHYNKILFLSHLLMAIISFDIWLYLIALPALLSLHGSGIQTGLAHNNKLGYRPYDTKDNSVNVPLLFPLILAEAWHNNHHKDAKNPTFGGTRWWEIDPTYWFIKLIKTS